MCICDPQISPLFKIPCHLCAKWMKRRKDSHNTEDAWRHHEVDEAMLTARFVDLLAVVEEANGDTQALLLFALMEELVQHPHCPSVTNLEGLKWVRDVGEVEHGFQPHDGLLLQQLLCVALLVGARIKRLCFANIRVELVDGVELLDHLEVVGHVGMKNCLNTHLSNLAELLWRAHRKHVSLGVLTYLEKLRTMHILQWRLVIVAQSPLMPCVHQECIGHTKVPQIMAECSGHNAESPQITGPCVRLGLLQQAIHGVCGVTGVLEVVVWILQIPLLHLPVKLQEDLQVNIVPHAAAKVRVKVDMQNHHAQFFLRQVQDVEIPRVDDLQINRQLVCNRR
mmetsp:Transcript_30774/g.71899  ORF Transcript_30774/g.71899 Transcript_30774/m.71899 type:complete len:338 (-) Transcript_30774:1526-2539(-)